MLRNHDNSGTQLPHRARNLSLWVRKVFITGYCGIACCGAAQAGADTDKQFEAALYREIVSGDLAGSMDQYETILKEPGTERRLAAASLLRIGLCEEKLGRRKEAYASYARIVAEYGDQAEVFKQAQVKLAAWSGPRNLKFEEGAAGKAPPGWFVPSLPKDADYLAEVQRDRCRSRSGCAVVVAPANVPRAIGNLMQSFSAAAYSGKLVRLRAWLRLESIFVSPALGLRLPAPEDRAQLWLTVERTNRRKGFSENMDDRPVRSSDWTESEIVGEIDKDAQFINFGILSIGGGRVWVDDVSFDVISQPDRNRTLQP
jgi:hypothetical protein